MGFGEATLQASSFLLDKYKTAKRVLSDVSQAELMTEEATNSEPQSPDARTMTKIADAAFQFDDYWRIIDVLHRRLHSVNFKEWRQSYKALVLLDFLVTHGPEGMAEEFLCDVDVILELGMFRHIDERGFNWGLSMQMRSERILKLLRNEGFLKEARHKALKLSSEIHGFGNRSPNSPASFSFSSMSSRASSFGSLSSSISTMSPGKWDEKDELIKLHRIRDQQQQPQWPPASPVKFDKETDRINAAKAGQFENGSLLGLKKEEKEHDKCCGGETSIIAGKRAISFRSLSEVGKVMRRTFDRQLSLGF